MLILVLTMMLLIKLKDMNKKIINAKPNNETNN